MPLRGLSQRRSVISSINQINSPLFLWKTSKIHSFSGDAMPRDGGGRFEFETRVMIIDQSALLSPFFTPLSSSSISVILSRLLCARLFRLSDPVSLPTVGMQVPLMKSASNDGGTAEVHPAERGLFVWSAPTVRSDVGAGYSLLSAGKKNTNLA